MEENKEPTPQDPPEAPEDSIESRPEETPPASAEIEIPPPPLTDGQPDLAETPTPVEEAMEESQAEKEPTKFQLFLRKALIWLGVILGAALAGFLVFYFALYRPKVAELRSLDEQLTSANEEIATLNEDLAEANERLAELENAEFHSILLDVATDIYAARLALGDENTVAAKAALASTNAKLAQIEEDLSAFDSKLAEELPQRLSLLRSSIDSNIDKAIADCEIILDDLSEAEAALMP